VCESPAQGPHRTANEGVIAYQEPNVRRSRSEQAAIGTHKFCREHCGNGNSCGWTSEIGWFQGLGMKQAGRGENHVAQNDFPVEVRLVHLREGRVEIPRNWDVRIEGWNGRARIHQ
jgi:hypothetical protein